MNFLPHSTAKVTILGGR